MSTEAAHLAVAERNQRVIDYLLERLDDTAEWVVTVAFYKALHLVEALFAHERNQHGHNHETRDARLKTEPRYQQIYRHYRVLWAAATIARYLEDNRGSKYRAFSEYMSHDNVRSEILGHRLRQVEHSVRKLLG